MAPGLYLPKSVREMREQREAQMEADMYAAGLPDFKDAMELQKAVRLRDERMSVTWCKEGPNMNRWVILRTDDNGMPNVVMVVQNPDGTYRAPTYKLADTLIDTWSGAGNSILREMEKEQERRSREAERVEEENNRELAERVTSAIANAHGFTDRAFISKGLK